MTWRRTANKHWNGFPLYLEVLRAIMHINPSIYCGKPFQCLLVVLLQVIEFCHCKFDMSWKKQSAEAGLAGLSLWEAALGTLWDETMVKKMPDPLGQTLDLSRVKKEDLFMVVRFTVYSRNVFTVHSTVYMYVSKKSRSKWVIMPLQYTVSCTCICQKSQSK